MGRQWNPESIPDASVLPAGAYLLSIESIEETASRAGALMYNFNFRVVEPAALVGLPYYEHCNIGSPADPEAADPETWKLSIGARVMKRIFKAAGVELSEDLDDVIATATGQQVVGIINQTIQGKKNRDGSDNPYADRPQNNSAGWYAPGEREVGLEAANGAQAPAPRAAAPAAKPAPAAARPAAPAARAATPPSAAPARPVARLPSTFEAAAAAPAARPVAKAATEKLVRCSICNTDVPRSTFAAHVEECDEAHSR